MARPDLGTSEDRGNPDVVESRGWRSDASTAARGSWGGENSRTTELIGHEYLLASGTRNDIGLGGVNGTSPDPHLVTQPRSRLPGRVDQGDLAFTDRDTPAERPGDVDQHVPDQC